MTIPDALLAVDNSEHNAASYCFERLVWCQYTSDVSLGDVESSR